MKQPNDQNQDVVEKWLGAWWEWVSPIHHIVQTPVFNACLQDSQKAYQKAVSYWLEKPEVFQSKLSGWATEFQSVVSDKGVDHLDNLELMNTLLVTQKTMARNLSDLISETKTLTDREALLLKFNLRQIMAFADPRNSIFSNPGFLQRAVETEGQSLFSGCQQYQSDIEKSLFIPKVQRTELGPNRLGQSFSASPGSIIYQNKLIQLIHYEAHEVQQNKTPLLIVPPCINKFYVLDLSPENSFVHWLCRQGHDVYMISWINPGQEMADITFDNYIQDGCLAAINVVTDFAKTKRLNLLGYCIGGLMASIAAASIEGQDKVESLTLLTTLLDYSSPGELSVFISPEILEALRQEIAIDGVLKSESMSLAFTLLREEQLLWRYIRKHYYLGEPLSFDAITYWGQDSTNLPGKMALDYLDNFYLKNCLAVGKYYQFNDEAVSLTQNDIPKYILACEQDRIAPVSAVMAGTELLGGNVRLVTASGGHVKGVVNHPSENRGNFTINSAEIKEGISINGSWWHDWQEWIVDYSGKRGDARPCVTVNYPEIEAAPGSYVRQ